MTELERYLFDLNGFIILRQAIPVDVLAALNADLDQLRSIKPGEWRGHVHGHFFANKSEGLNLQQIYEAGPAWEFLIDNPAWIEHVKFFVGGEGSFDYAQGPLFIDENFASIRGPGEAIGVHSGPVPWVKRCQFHVSNQKFNCGQINVLMALNKIGPGDGATMVIPASHKANFRHPEFDKHVMKGNEATSVDGLTGAIEVHLDAGDVLIFVDAICHGSARRVNPGERRLAVYRYGPSWGFFRHPYRPSQALLERLTPERRKIVFPHEKVISPAGSVSAAVS
ncbi:MAG: phytanoyl-CoA dioxygenase family protein [Verrucomicrobia bacterium]|nr:phytanoyl-CoA dioxygenase family protein [Verrucomicrobiota bacterium]